MSYSIGFLSKKFNLSRSTLLYYDSVGLLKASGRTDKNYRKYSDEDINRLEQICMYRQTGLSIKEIKEILDCDGNATREVLDSRLMELNEYILKIRSQQRMIIDILKNEKLLESLTFIDKDLLINLLSNAGFDELDMCKLHGELEKLSPQSHQEFLRALGFNQEEIKEIRTEAQTIIMKR
ncbi:MerR family transcriptional regulator [Candidatus Contubernalis alkaliaceticus]|uniref:MerR family transcriptional regulator n=1 Tax=Candidatus Contubernalis alkaliaceticus TaxID=338645 RepID=UPI001F4C4F1C|nr:MerR family transcriptional regulator [Candidatus Contubernalis alkalaceticus]UNC91336.1 MerR family transcriptional regulator [Candidatus Contubernalis alkalaceticus]